MSTSHGPLLNYIARNEQRQKLAAAAHERRARSAQPRARRLPHWRCGWRADGQASRLLHRIRQIGSVLRGGDLIANAREREPRREAGDRPNPRLSS